MKFLKSFIITIAVLFVGGLILGLMAVGWPYSLGVPLFILCWTIVHDILWAE